MNVSVVMWDPMIVKDFFPGHVIVNGAEPSVGEFCGIVWGSLKPHLEVPLQKADLEAFPTNDLDGLFHEVHLQ